MTQPDRGAALGRISEALQDIRELTAKYHAPELHQALGKLLSLKSDPEQFLFRAAWDSALWGGSGSVADLIFYAEYGDTDEETAMRDGRRLLQDIIDIAEAVAELGIANSAAEKRGTHLRLYGTYSLGHCGGARSDEGR